MPRKVVPSVYTVTNEDVFTIAFSALFPHIFRLFARFASVAYHLHFRV